MVRAPVGHRAAGIIVPETKIYMASLRKIFKLRRLPLPEIPIEIFRNGRVLERTFAQTRGQPNRHLFQFSQAAIADQFARQPKSRVAALLAPALTNRVLL